MSDFERGRYYWIGSYLNFSFARPVVKKPVLCVMPRFLLLHASREFQYTMILL